ncbi:MAG: hypothetical protein E7493_04745 [Ruminococcus albus]|nr:hypothetical protein [Ruminococcus albus]
MTGTRTPCASIYWVEKMKKIHKRAYIFVIVFGWICIFFPYVAHGDILGYEIQDVYAEITDNVYETNEILRDAFNFCQTSPYSVVNSIAGTDQGNVAAEIITASKYMALIVAVLLLMVEFFRKSINFEWSSKWENVLIFLVKIIVIKQVVQNADVIIGYIYAGFNYINTAALNKITSGSVTIDFLPCGNCYDYTWSKEQSFVEQLHKGWWDFWEDRASGSNVNTYTYTISQDAVKMFYPNAVFPDDASLDGVLLENPTSKANFMPTLEIVKLQPFFLGMKALAYFIFVIVAGRVFELAVYTLFAPLPLATFASEGSHDIAKGFIKNYVATVIQIAVIVAMFIVYVALNQYVVELFSSTKMIQLVVLITLGLGVFKSGTWAKKICGAA